MVSRVIHFEIPIDDPPRAGTFYQNVFGWTVSKQGPVDYWTMTTGAPPGPGAEGALALRSEAPDGVLVYIRVDEIDDALAKIEAAGGERISEKTPVPGFGWTATFRDSEGNLLGLFQEEDSEAPGVSSDDSGSSS
ncbi:VOC family protein [Mycetocola miduiensis]|uniref:VOC domain-containing protein n=1 Tax=Mycetocola miduiensis TaxID=995034 RepID=A0A1I4ZX90_9MICO|nr:VOC family protein [Mycetocola miduiensis]SFN54781.1 hypothetical protein SAMN05216219_1154 [Mycetocola miduiensis]